MTELERNLNELDSLARALVGSLEAEHAALGKRAVEPIERLAAEKKDLCQRLDRQLIAVKKTLIETGADPTKHRLSTLCEERGVGALWRAVSATLARCRDMNKANGRVLDGARTVNRRLLEIFSGVSAAPPTYGARGEVRQTPVAVPIARV